MRHALDFYIDGKWVSPAGREQLDVINPATEASVGAISLGTADDIEAAVKAARLAFKTWGFTGKQERLEMLESILSEYNKRYSDMVDAITLEMGAPKKTSYDVQVAMGVMHLESAITALKGFQFSSDRGTTRIDKEPIGVCGFITPWNWPINQVASKVAPAIATGCTMVLKPSEIAPFSSIVWSEIMEAAGTPKGIYNMVNGDGAGAGSALSSHPDVDMISFTGSTRAGVLVAQSAAPTVKRVHQELGGKSANILLSDADMEACVKHCVNAIVLNAGQNCNAPTRLLVPEGKIKEVEAIAEAAVGEARVGKPEDDVDMGPVVSDVQWSKIQGLIKSGIAEGAKLISGGADRPEGLETGYYVKPTIFSRATNQMEIAREEIFGPVLTIIPYGSISEAVEIANDTPYGLASYVSGKDQQTVRDVASQMRSGQVVVNCAKPDPMAPFGGYKQSGNGREWGDYAFDEFLEVKAVLGYH